MLVLGQPLLTDKEKAGKFYFQVKTLNNFLAQVTELRQRKCANIG